jgi:drug/metabolite transporter (DMT)-like permease
MQRPRRVHTTASRRVVATPNHRGAFPATLRHGSSVVRSHLGLAVVAALWGGAFVAIRNLDASGRISASAITLLRFALTAAVMAPVLAFRRPRIQRADWRRVWVMGLLGGLVYHLALNEGERFVSAGVASLIVASVPVMVAILAARFLGERLTKVRAAGIALAIGGVAVLVVLGSGGSLHVHNLVGALLVLVSPSAWAISTVVGKPMVRRYDPIALTALLMVLGATLIVPFTIVPTVRDLPNLTGGDWLQLVYLAVGCTALAYAIWYAALRHLEATTVAGYIYLVPPFALLWAAVFLGERVTVAGALGGAMVLAGVLVAERLAPRLEARSRRSARAETADRERLASAEGESAAEPEERSA